MQLIQQLFNNGLYMLTPTAAFKLNATHANNPNAAQPMNLTQTDRQNYYTVFELLLEHGVAPNSNLFKTSTAAYAARNAHMSDKAIFFITSLRIEDVDLLIKFNAAVEHIVIQTNDCFVLSKKSRDTYFHTESADALKLLGQAIQEKKLPNLKKIDLDVMMDGPDSLNPFISEDIFKSLGPYLHHLKLKAPQDMPYIDKITTHCTHLKSLALDFICIPLLPDFLNLSNLWGSPLKSLEKLTELEMLIIDQHVTDISYLKNLTALKYLSINSNVNGLFNHLPFLPQLTQLRLSALDGSLSPNGLISFAEKMPALEFLDLTNWAVYYEPINEKDQKEALITLLQKAPALKHVSGLGLNSSEFNARQVSYGFKYTPDGLPIPEYQNRNIYLRNETVNF